MRLAVVRVRGRVGIRKEIEETLNMLRLTRANYCVLIDDRREYLGMLAKVKDHITWGEVDTEAVARLLRLRGELEGGKKLTDSYLKKSTPYRSVEAFAKDFISHKAELKDIPGLKPFFRLHPPRKGYGGVKRSVREGGALGHRKDMKSLLYKMR
jgi:large subunit ribosomal protein L30